MTGLIRLPQPRHPKKSLNQYEEIILQTSDAFFFDDPALHSNGTLDSVRKAIGGATSDSVSLCTDKIEDLVKGIDNEIQLFSKFQRKIYWKRFYTFYSEGESGLSAAKKIVIAGILRSISEYLESIAGSSGKYSNHDVIDFIKDSTKIIEDITIEEFKNYMEQYEHSSIIYISEITSLVEEMAFDIIQDQLNEELFFKILYE